MKFKKLIVLFIILGALVVVAVVKKTAIKSRAIPFEKAEEATSLELTPKITPDFISKIIFYKGSEESNKIVFSKNTSNEWLVENKFGARAQKNFLEKLIKDLSQLKGELRADSKNVFSDFQIADNEGLHLILMNTAGKESVHVVVGLKMVGWSSSFVRVFGTQKVSLVEKNFLMSLGVFDPKAKLQVQPFLDLKVFSNDPAKADRFEIKLTSAASLALKKITTGTTPGWQFDPFDSRAKIDQTKIDEFLRLIANLYAQDVMDPKGATYSFDKPTLTVVVNIKEKEVSVSYQLEIGKFNPDQKSYFARLQPGNTVYVIPENVVMNLKKDKTFFLQQTPKK